MATQNLSVYDSVMHMMYYGCSKPTRIAKKVVGTRKVRACKKCRAELG